MSSSVGLKKRGKSLKTNKEDKNLKDVKDKEAKDEVLTDKKKDKESRDGDEPAPPKFGPMPKLAPHRLWSRTALILGLMVIVWYNSRNSETTLAPVEEEIRYKSMKVKCSPAFTKDVSKFTGCNPNHCGRIVTDELIMPEELFALNDFVGKALKEGGSSAGSSLLVFDLSSGLLRIGEKSVDLYKLNKTRGIFGSGDQLIFQSMKSKMMRMVSSFFGVDYWSLHLTKPAYVSRLSSGPGGSKKEEYWHLMVHKDAHKTYDYSSVVFLSEYKRDFEGGRLIFVDGDNTNRTVEARKGRAIAFTSGEENKHFNERVSRGSRLALTMGFTCDSTKATKDPL